MKSVARFLLGLAVALLATVWLGSSQAHASEWAEYWFPTTSGLNTYYGGMITAQTAASPGYQTSLTSKCCIRLEYLESSQLSAGWKMYNNWAYPKAYYSYPQFQGFFWQEVDVLVTNQTWGTSKVYELLHKPSWGYFDNVNWEIYVGGIDEGKFPAVAQDGDQIIWAYDGIRAGGRTSDTNTKLWGYVTSFSRTADGVTWGPVINAGLNTSVSGWVNILALPDSHRFKVYSDNMTP